MSVPTVILDEPCAALREAVAAFAPVLLFKSSRGFLSSPHLLVEELDHVLATATAGPPYVYVAASFGGFAALEFAHRFPARLAGMILVDASHPEQGSVALGAIPSDEPVTPAVADFQQRLQGFGPVWTESCAAVGRIKQLGRLRLIVLAAGQPDMPAGLRPQTREELTQGWHRLQSRHAALSTRGELRMVPGAGHDLVRQAPSAVLAAIREQVLTPDNL
jgi:pimeloyl-ACP methyl ester carboxylesterase